uniref:Uncharacterized protein n=1 Tax=Romanomermis culicivorax TaxID=13658 RepID=A0A915J8Q4_ROMCU
MFKPEDHMIKQRIVLLQSHVLDVTTMYTAALADQTTLHVTCNIMSRDTPRPSQPMADFTQMYLLAL